MTIEQVKNPYLEEAYEAMKKIISKQCKGFNPNERFLFHGTKEDGITGITEDGFDDRFLFPRELGVSSTIISTDDHEKRDLK